MVQKKKRLINSWTDKDIFFCESLGYFRTEDKKQLNPIFLRIYTQQIIEYFIQI